MEMGTTESRTEGLATAIPPTALDERKVSSEIRQGEGEGGEEALRDD